MNGCSFASLLLAGTGLHMFTGCVRFPCHSISTRFANESQINVFLRPHAPSSPPIAKSIATSGFFFPSCSWKASESRILSRGKKWNPAFRDSISGGMFKTAEVVHNEQAA